MTDTQRAYQLEQSNPLYTTPSHQPRGINAQQAVSLSNPEAQRPTNPMPPKIVYPIAQPFTNEWAGTHGTRPGAITSSTAAQPFSNPVAFQGANNFIIDNPTPTPFPLNMRGGYVGYSYGF